MRIQSTVNRFFSALFFVIMMACCNAQSKTESYDVYGNDFEKINVVSGEKVLDFYDGITATDSINVALKADVIAVCKAKGCWMKLDVGSNEEVMVKFKDYAFFVPKDIEGKEVIINGKAFVNLVSVEEQRHYAKDAGKSEKEIATITKPQKTYSFEATGVKIKE